MLKTAFSTVACPDWTTERVARAAAEYGYRAVELRTFADRCPDAFASEPAYTDPARVRAFFRDQGVLISGLATGIRFDAPVFPPVMGHVFSSRHASVREGKRAVELAAAVGASYVRVYAHRVPGSPAPLVPADTKWSALRRITARLREVCDHARNRDLRVVIENGADFASCIDLAKIIELVGSPLLGACYDLDAGVASGDHPADAVRLLGDRLLAARVSDRRMGVPCPLGQGDLPVRPFIHALRDSGSSAWVVYTWEKAWLPNLAQPDQVLPVASCLLHDWCGRVAQATAAA